MRKSGLGLLLILTFVLVLGAVIQDFRFDTSLTKARASALAVDREFASAEIALANLRLAQATYVATDQVTDAAARRVADLFEQLETTIANLRGTTAASALAGPHYAGAATALTELAAVDKRARDNIRNEQRLLASDQIFVDGSDVSDRLTSALSGARQAESRAAETRMASLTRIRFGMNAVALGLVLIVTVYAGVGSRETTAPVTAPATSTAQMLRDLPPAMKPAPAPVPAPTPRPATAASVTNLADAAELCVDLGRVMDERDIPALVERSARVLDAKGIIIWIADRAGTVLRPSLAHGYSEQILARLGTLDVTADNATTQSFKSMRPQAVNGTAMGTAGAIAIPLLTAAGCAGVLAVEFRDSRPAAEMVAVAKIISAQFAALIGPPSEEVESRAAEA